MAKWRQGDTFEDATTPKAAEVEEAPVQVVEDEEGNKKRKVAPKFRTIALAVGVTAVLIAVVVLVIRMKADNDDIMSDPNSPAVDDIINPSGSGNIDDFLNPGGVDMFSYTQEEREELRAWGYTGSEIEQFQTDKIEASTKVEEARRLREETWAALNNPESPEYRALLDQTWLGEEATQLPAPGEGIQSIEQKTINADYVRVPPHGRNMFIKVDMHDGTFYFMQCKPDLYVSLEDSGNINLRYDLYTFSSGISFIYNMQYLEVS